MIFSATVEFISSLGLTGPWDRGIDLGGGRGFVARLLKSAGVIKHASNLDLMVFPNANDELCRKFLKQVVLSGAPLDSKLSDILSRARNAHQHAVGQNGLDGLWRDFPNDPVLDQDIQANIFEHEGEYDFVTSNQFLQYFDPEAILPKLRSIMRPGGLLTGYLDCWWFPITSAGIVGHFPYSVQRLSLPDLKRYWAEFHPDLKDSFERKYSYFHAGSTSPSASDWERLARKHGFEPIAVHRVVPQRHNHVADMPADIFSNPDFSEGEALRDIHRINPSVTRDDLFTSYYRLAFRAV